jgi:casein kinase I family protein HRR25
LERRSCTVLHAVQLIAVHLRVSLKLLSTSIVAIKKGLPEELAIYLNYFRSLTFKEMPRIGYLRKLFKDLLFRIGHGYDFVFDLMIKKL